MPPATGRGSVRVNAQGLTDLRRALRKASPAVDKRITTELRGVANIVRDEARMRAPVGNADSGDPHPGQLRRKIRSSVTRKRAAISVVGVDYAEVQEFGGTIRPRGYPIHITGTDFLYGAAIHHEPEIERRLESVIAIAFREAGL